VSEWRDHFDAIHDLRVARGYVWLGTQEADPRARGGDRLLWGRLPDDTLEVCVVEGDGTVHDWERIDEAEFAARWPHANVPSSLADAVKR
jgi:hypothetical protein